MKNTTFNRSRLASAVSVALAVSGMAVALPAAAQEEAEVMEEVIVTGYRKSLIDSIENKRYNSSVIESISAEDIGKLPDSSIAESLARLPGLAAQRRDDGGEEPRLAGARRPLDQREALGPDRERARFDLAIVEL